MSGKISTIILKVDLQCRQCYKKIRKTLCKLQDLDRGKIQVHSVVYDEKEDSITISGPFDPKKLLKTICYNAGKVVKDIQIVENKPEPKPVEPPPPEPEPAPPAPEPEPKPVQPTPEPEASPPVEPEPAPPAPEPTPPAPEPPASEPEPPMPEPDPTIPNPDPPAAPAPTQPPEPEPEPEPEPKPKPEPPKKVEPEPPKPEPEVKQLNHLYSYPSPVWTPGPMAPGPVCCCKPWFEAYYGGGSKCCSCGWVYGTASHGPPTPVYYGASGYNGQPTPAIYGESYYGGRPTPVICGEPYYNGLPATYGGLCYDGPPKQVYGGSSYYNGPNNCPVVCEEGPSCRIM